VGSSTFNVKHSKFVKLCIDSILKLIGKDYNSISYLHNTCNSVGKLDLNLSGYNDSNYDLTYIYKADNISLSNRTFNIYVGNNVRINDRMIVELTLKDRFGQEWTTEPLVVGNVSMP